jgi:hypothetical protein
MAGHGSERGNSPVPFVSKFLSKFVTPPRVCYLIRMNSETCPWLVQDNRSRTGLCLHRASPSRLKHC